MTGAMLPSKSSEQARARFQEIRVDEIARWLGPLAADAGGLAGWEFVSDTALRPA